MWSVLCVATGVPVCQAHQKFQKSEPFLIRPEIVKGANPQIFGKVSWSGTGIDSSVPKSQPSLGNHLGRRGPGIFLQNRFGDHFRTLNAICATQPLKNTGETEDKFRQNLTGSLNIPVIVQKGEELVQKRLTPLVFGVELGVSIAGAE